MNLLTSLAGKEVDSNTALAVMDSILSSEPVEEGEERANDAAVTEALAESMGNIVDNLMSADAAGTSNITIADIGKLMASFA